MALLSDLKWELLDGISRRDNPLPTITTNEGEEPPRENEINVEDVLKSFHFVIRDNVRLLESALEILDKEGPRKAVQEYMHAASGRTFWRVLGSRDSSYLCLERYCSCQSYAQLGRGNDQRVLCKHLLAVRVAHRLGEREKETHCLAAEDFRKALSSAMLSVESAEHQRSF